MMIMLGQFLALATPTFKSKTFNGQKPENQCINEKYKILCLDYFYALMHFKASYNKAYSNLLCPGPWKHHLKKKN